MDEGSCRGDGKMYYEYLMMYVDDILVISCDAQALLNEVQGTFKFKDDKIDVPEF